MHGYTTAALIAIALFAFPLIYVAGERPRCERRSLLRWVNQILRITSRWPDTPQQKASTYG